MLVFDVQDVLKLKQLAADDARHAEKVLLDFRRDAATRRAALRDFQQTQKLCKMLDAELKGA